MGLYEILGWVLMSIVALIAVAVVLGLIVPVIAGVVRALREKEDRS